MSLNHRVLTSRDPRNGAASAEAPDNRRWAFRKRGLIPALIISDRLGDRIGCTVRDLSATGGRLTIAPARNMVVAGTRDLPNTFVLVLERENVEVDCEIAWRSETDVGVRFLSAMRHLPKRIVPRIVTAKKK